MSANPSRQWVIASGNAGKIRELAELLSPLRIELKPQSDFSVQAAEETGRTFIENALIKARHASSETGLPALADDSGLVVPALDGAPGLYSARYAGPGSTDAQNCQHLLNELEKHPESGRSAFFLCIVVRLEHADDPAPLVLEGRWEGRIATRIRGRSGFGYDPIFIPEVNQNAFLGETGGSRTAAEFSAEEKNAVSHRGQAVRKLLWTLQGGVS